MTWTGRWLAVPVLSASINVYAQDVFVEKVVGLELAKKAAAAAVHACAQDGFAVSAAVVGRAGYVKALLRADGASPHTLDSSRRKAYTALALRMETTAALEISRRRPDAAHLGEIEGFLLLGGGMPIRVGDEVIGAIGVGGAPGGELDDKCAAAGIAAIDAKQLK